MHTWLILFKTENPLRPIPIGRSITSRHRALACTMWPDYVDGRANIISFTSTARLDCNGVVDMP